MPRLPKEANDKGLEKGLALKIARETFNEFYRTTVKKYKKGDIKELFNLMEMQANIIVENESYEESLKDNPALKKEVMKYFFSQVIHSLITPGSFFDITYDPVQLIKDMREYFKDSKLALSCINELNFDHIDVRDIYSLPSLQRALRKQAQEEFSEENLDFLLALDKAMKSKDYDLRDFENVYNNYIKEGVEHQINLSAERRLPLDKIFKNKTDTTERPAIESAFNDAKAEIETLLERDTFRRLKNGKKWDERQYVFEKCEKYGVPPYKDKKEETKVDMIYLQRLATAKSKRELLSTVKSKHNLLKKGTGKKDIPPSPKHH